LQRVLAHSITKSATDFRTLVRALKIKMPALRTPALFTACLVARAQAVVKQSLLWPWRILSPTDGARVNAVRYKTDSVDTVIMLNHSGAKGRSLTRVLGVPLTGALCPLANPPCPSSKA